MAVDLQNFTKEQEQLFNRANALGTGVDTVNSQIFQENTIDLESSPTVNVGSTPPLTEDTLTGEQEKAQEEDTRIQDLTNQLLGESEFTTGQETEQDISGKEALTTSLRNQMKALGLESEDLGLQVGEAAQAVQENVAGRGVTAGGAAPLTASAQRKVNLKRAGVRSQMLIVQGQLYAAEGDLASAQKAVDDAVSQKYDPIKEELEIKLANYDRIINSPKANLEEKNQARKLAELDRIRLEKIGETANLDTAVKNVGIEAASLGADAVLLKAIDNAVDEDGNPDPIEAERLLAESGLVSQKGDFTTSQTQKLEQAGLLNSSRQEQLDFLYGGGGSSTKLNERVKGMFAQDFANQIIFEFNNEELTEFIRDFQAVQDELQINLEPKEFLKEWKKEVGISGSSSKKTTERKIGIEKKDED